MAEEPKTDECAAKAPAARLHGHSFRAELALEGSSPLVGLGAASPNPRQTGISKQIGPRCL